MVSRVQSYMELRAHYRVSGFSGAQGIQVGIRGLRFIRGSGFSQCEGSVGLKIQPSDTVSLY